jgi:hypothetical protein
MVLGAMMCACTLNKIVPSRSDMSFLLLVF